MPEIAFLNGSFMPIADAVVSIEDRGFQLGDGVYEVIVTYDGRPYALAEHLARLRRSLNEIRIAYDIDAYGLQGIIEDGVRRSGYADALIYIQITRGVAPRRHQFPDDPIRPTVVITVTEYKRPPPEEHAKGVMLISTSDQRWHRCDIKSICLLPNALARQEAAEAGAYEALLVNSDGYVTEGAATSAFCVRAGELWTTPEGPHILPSISRAILLKLARQADIPVHEGFRTLEFFKGADEVFLAGTTTETLAVVQIDERIIGTGKPGPITGKIRAAFLETL